MAAYTPSLWRDFGVSVAGLAGALTGLLFVAVSIKSEALSRSRNLSSRAAETLVLFMTPAIISIVLVTPQPALALGWELLAAAVMFGTALFILNRRAEHEGEAEGALARYLRVASPNTLTVSLVAIAGLTFVLKAGGGLYWLIPAFVTSLVGGVMGAWLFLLKTPG
jgi:hypothetical protein